jgi:hypothetical protein
MKNHLHSVITYHDHHMHISININAPIGREECETLKEKLDSLCQVKQKQRPQKPPRQKQKPQKWKKERRRKKTKNAPEQTFGAAPASSARQLPPELNTAEARRYLDKAKALGLIDKHYRWLKGKQLLACFCRDMSLKLHLGKGERIAWLPFETLFGIKKLRYSYNDIQKTGCNPSDIGLVDSIFQ